MTEKDNDGKPQRPPGSFTFSDMMGELKNMDPLKDFQRLPQVPCARQALLTGMTAGAGIGGIRFLFSRRVLNSANWAVATFGLTSLLSWERCRSKMVQEHIRMRSVIEEFRTSGKLDNNNNNAQNQESNASTSSTSTSTSSSSSSSGGRLV